MKKNDDGQIEILFWYLKDGNGAQDSAVAKKAFNYINIKSQRMTVPKGCRFICQEAFLADDDDIIGCFIDKDEYSVHWFHTKTSRDRSSKSYQSVETMPVYALEYPILAFNGPYPDSRELTLVNLADMSNA